MLSCTAAANPGPGVGRARGWQAKAPAPQFTKCRNSRYITASQITSRRAGADLWAPTLLFFDMAITLRHSGPRHFQTAQRLRRLRLPTASAGQIFLKKHA